MIGPMAAGKTTLARAVSAALDLPYAPLDWIGFAPMVRHGLDVRAYEAASDWAARDAIRRPHCLAAAEAALRDFPDFVLDFGAGHAHADDPTDMARLEALLAPMPHVVWVRPHEDPDEGVRIVTARDQARFAAQGHAWDASREPALRAFVHSPCFPRLATMSVVTGGRDIDACVDEVVAAVSR